MTRSKPSSSQALVNSGGGQKNIRERKLGYGRSSLYKKMTHPRAWIHFERSVDHLRIYRANISVLKIHSDAVRVEGDAICCSSEGGWQMCGVVVVGP